VLDLAWNIGCTDILQWCHDHGVLYLNTSVELWDPYADAATTPPTERTLYVRHMAIRAMMERWGARGPTAVLEHGANPGLVSHFTKVALRDIAGVLLSKELPAARRRGVEAALTTGDYARLAMLTGTKVIHISERDTQVADRPKR